MTSIPARKLTTLALVTMLLAVCGCGSGSGSKSSSSSTSAEPAPSLTGTGYPNSNLHSTRDVPSSINGTNVSSLRLAWTLPITGKSTYGSYASTPVVSDGVIYSEDLESNVQAISLKTGKVLWTRSFESPDQGPNGVVVADGRVYGATTTSAFALEQKTGSPLWTVPLVRNGEEGIDMAPGYHEGIVYVSTVPGTAREFYKGNGVGILWALNAATGAKLWHFNTVPEDLWSPKNVSINSGGGVWYAPSFDEHGYMYFGIGNPGPFPGTESDPWGSSRPGPDLYTDSIVKLNAKTGKLRWYYQLTPHDLYDWDLQDPPLLVNEGGRQVVITAGKAGFVLALDANSGKLLWKRAVGMHNGHEHDSLYAMRHEYSRLKTTETVYPGLLGGVIAPMATDGKTVFVPVVNNPVKYAGSQTKNQEGPPGPGELVALDAATGAVRWVHQFTAPAFGGATVANDVVYTIPFNGLATGLETSTGKVLWEAQLPAGSNGGIAIEGDTLIAPAGLPQSSEQTAELVAYRIG
jgi:glucose dehydrogenase